MTDSIYLHTRVTAEQKAEIKAAAKAADMNLSEFVRAAIEAFKPERALSDGSAGCGDSQAQAERVAGSTGSSVPIAEQRDQFIESRSRHLFSQGSTSNQARRQAEREWAEANPI